MNITTHKTQDFRSNSKGELVCETSYDVEIEGATVGWVEQADKNRWSATRFDESEDTHFVGFFSDQNEAVKALIPTSPKCHSC